MISAASNNNYNFRKMSPKISFKGNAALLNDQVLHALVRYKSGAIYDINHKLRGVIEEKLTGEDKKIIKGLLSAPREKLLKGVYVYRGICDGWAFDPFKSFLIGNLFHEEGFTALSPIESTAKEFRYGHGVLAKIFLPKGTEYIDIDNLLINNIDRLPDSTRNYYMYGKNPRHEWILLPDADYFIKSYSNKGSLLDPNKPKRHSKRIDYNSLGKFILRYLPCNPLKMVGK
jgi:hypothetical protein